MSNLLKSLDRRSRTIVYLIGCAFLSYSVFTFVFSVPPRTLFYTTKFLPQECSAIFLCVNDHSLSYRYYSMYGHVEKLAEKIREGAASVEGVEAKLWQVLNY